MAIAVRIDNTAPASAASPDGTAAFPFSMVPGGGLPSTSQQKIVTGNSAANAGQTVTLAPDAGRQAWLAGASVSGLVGTIGMPASILVQVANLFGGTGSLFFVIPGNATASSPIPVFTVTFSPPLQGNGVGVGPNCIVPAFGSTGGVSTVSLWGYEV
jgi:hypothetical protein